MTTDTLPASDEMVQGYCDGLNDDRMALAENHNRSQQYIQGWLNGRDDRIGKPRDIAQNIRETSNELIKGDL